MDYKRRYGNGGSVDRLRMAFGGKMRYAENGTMVDTDPERPKVFVTRGYDNRAIGQRDDGVVCPHPTGDKTDYS